MAAATTAGDSPAIVRTPHTLGPPPRKGSPPGRRGTEEGARPAGTARSASPELPRAMGMATAQAAGQFDGSSAVSSSARPPQAILEPLARIASALERGGVGGEAGSTASKAVLAAVTALVSHLGAGGACTELPRLPPDLEDQVGQIKRSLADLGSAEAGGGRPWQLRADHIEKEVAELRAQVARRLDVAAAEVAASRRDADDARAELLALRQEMAEMSARLDKAERSAQQRRSGAGTAWSQAASSEPQSLVAWGGQQPASSGGAQHSLPVQHYDISSCPGSSLQSSVPGCTVSFGNVSNS